MTSSGPFTVLEGPKRRATLAGDSPPGPTAPPPAQPNSIAPAADPATRRTRGMTAPGRRGGGEDPSLLSRSPSGPAAGDPAPAYAQARGHTPEDRLKAASAQWLRDRVTALEAALAEQRDHGDHVPAWAVRLIARHEGVAIFRRSTQTGLEVFGRDAGRLLGRDGSGAPADWHDTIHAADRQAYLEAGRRWLERSGRETLVRDFRIIRPADGMAHWMREVAYLAAPATAESPAVIEGSITDIDQERDSVTRLEEAVTAALIASRATRDFLTMVSHELRTPLNAVIGLSELIANEALGPIGQPRYLEYARDIQAGGETLLEQFNEMLDVLKDTAASPEMRETQFPAEDLLDPLLARARREALNRGLRLSVAFAEGLPSVRGDKRYLRQALGTLLSNAIRFTPDGGAVGIAATTTGDGGLAFRITDTGVGMEQDHVRSLLAPFAALDFSSARSGGGLGLGLALSKRLIELHGGSLTVDTAPDTGTTITITLPQRRLTPQDPGHPAGRGG